MGFYGDGDSKAFANIENIYKNENVTKYECLWAFMVTVIARPLLTLKTYMEMENGDSKAFANMKT